MSPPPPFQLPYIGRNGRTYYPGAPSSGPAHARRGGSMGRPSGRRGSIGSGGHLPNVKIPTRARDTLRHIDRTGYPPKGVEGGRTYKNDGRQGSQILPPRTRSGKPIKYQEWDVSLPKNKGGRGKERLITGSDGSAWYSNDHYLNCTRIR